MEKLALIAGNGSFPIIFSKSAREKANLSLIAIGIKGDTLSGLSKYVDKLYWIRPMELGKLFSILSQEGISKAVFIGQISPRSIFSRATIWDSEAKKIFEGSQYKNAESIFSAIADRLSSLNITLINSTAYISDLLAKKGVLSKREPNKAEWEDINFGFAMAKKIADLDIGQTIVVKEKMVLAVEAFEGTNSAILRGGRICKCGSVVVKVSKPKQDLRFDIPVVGLKTILILRKIKAACLAIEADKTLFLNQDESLKLADRHNIAIAAV